MSDIFLETAWHIGITLVRDAIWHNNRCNWLGNWMEPHKGQYIPVTRSFGPDLYSGTSGIAYFLVQLYSIEEDRHLANTIEGAINQVLSTADKAPAQGFYCGKAGISFLLLEAGRKMDRPDWVEKGVQLLCGAGGPAGPGDPQKHDLDVISGIAGTIPVLCSYFYDDRRQYLLESAIALGNVLCQTARKEEGRVSWKTVPSARNLTGFSHGAAGISTSLLELFRLTGNREYLDVALNAIAYEQHYFDANMQNWPDFREDTSLEKPIYGVSWCHGAPGIALSRLRAYQITGDPIFKKQADIALNTTLAQTHRLIAQTNPLPNYSLCHGVGGNADILLEGKAGEYMAIARETGLKGISQYHKTDIPWPCGTAGNLSTPGLMMGLSGIGLFYLRLYDPTAFQTILLPSLKN